jgi:hypothetical protein
MRCQGRDGYDECPNVPTLELDTEDGWNTVPKWIDTIPVCDECYQNCHRGGFPNARPLEGA